MQKLIPVTEAKNKVMEVADKFNLPQTDVTLFDEIVSVWPIIDIENIKYINFVDLEQYLENFLKVLEKKNLNYLIQEHGYKCPVVDIIEFIESPDYYKQEDSLFPSIKQDLINIWAEPNRYIEVIATGAESIGKSYLSDCCMAYMTYLYSSYKDPVSAFGLAPGSSILFIQQSITMTKARKVLLDQFAQRIRQSPYFKRNFMFDTYVKSELRFPLNLTVLPLGGADTAAIGLNVFFAVLDELNFLARIKDSVHIRYTGEDEYDQAEKLYGAIIRRMKGRFQRRGKLPGKIILVSARNYPGDFTSRKVEEAKTDSSIYVNKCHSQWDAFPKDRFSSETFLVEVGNDYKNSKIITNREEAVEESDVIEVPVDLKKDFMRDIEGCLRSYGGIATGAKNRFLPDKEAITEASKMYNAVTGGQTLFKMESVVLSDLFMKKEQPDWGEIVNLEYIEEVINDKIVPFAAHVDVAVSECNAGIAIGRIIGWNNMPTYKYYDEREKGMVEATNVTVPVIMVDGVLAVMSKHGVEIDIELLGDLIIFLKGLINIRFGTADSYQSAQLLQKFRKYKIRSGIVSVETSNAPYIAVKQALKDKRMLYPLNKILHKELRELERDSKKDTIDKPAGGSKDLSDSLSSVTHVLSTIGSVNRSPRKDSRQPQQGLRSRRRKLRIV